MREKYRLRRLSPVTYLVTRWFHLVLGRFFWFRCMGSVRLQRQRGIGNILKLPGRTLTIFAKRVDLRRDFHATPFDGVIL